jgi:hypothetical protein
MPRPEPPMPPLALPAPPYRGTHRVTAPPRFRRRHDGLWLGLGLCFVTLLMLRHTDPR